MLFRSKNDTQQNMTVAAKWAIHGGWRRLCVDFPGPIGLATSPGSTTACRSSGSSGPRLHKRKRRLRRGFVGHHRCRYGDASVEDGRHRQLRRSSGGDQDDVVATKRGCGVGMEDGGAWDAVEEGGRRGAVERMVCG